MKGIMEKVIVQGKNPNVTLVFTAANDSSGGGIDTAYKILADLVIAKYRKEIKEQVNESRDICKSEYR